MDPESRPPPYAPNEAPPPDYQQAVDNQQNQSLPEKPPQQQPLLAPHQQPGYAPSQPGYAPSQPGYGPSQPGYGPSQPAYSPSQPGYGPSQPALGQSRTGYAPVPQTGYPPQSGYIPPQPGYRPPQVGVPVTTQPVVQPSTTVIVTAQPAQRASLVGALFLSCFVVFCCNCPMGTIAFAVAMVGTSKANAGDSQGAMNLNRWSMGISVAGIIMTIIVIIIAVSMGQVH